MSPMYLQHRKSESKSFLERRGSLLMYPYVYVMHLIPMLKIKLAPNFRRPESVGQGRPWMDSRV